MHIFLISPLLAMEQWKIAASEMLHVSILTEFAFLRFFLHYKKRLAERNWQRLKVHVVILNQSIEVNEYTSIHYIASTEQKTNQQHGKIVDKRRKKKHWKINRLYYLCHQYFHSRFLLISFIPWIENLINFDVLFFFSLECEKRTENSGFRCYFQQNTFHKIKNWNPLWCEHVSNRMWNTAHKLKSN